MKNYRHQKIIEIINDNEVETQEELLALLSKEGYQVTQATISRDIKQLNLRKTTFPSGKQCYSAKGGSEPVGGDKLVRILRAGFVSMEAAGNLLIIKTVSGMAMAVAAAIDAIPIAGMLGSIAGDDTIMCAIRDANDSEIIMEQINNLIE